MLVGRNPDTYKYDHLLHPYISLLSLHKYGIVLQRGVNFIEWAYKTKDTLEAADWQLK